MYIPENIVKYLCDFSADMEMAPNSKEACKYLNVDIPGAFKESTQHVYREPLLVEVKGNGLMKCRESGFPMPRFSQIVKMHRGASKVECLA